jgi:hypothetical protein
MNNIKITKLMLKYRFYYKQIEITHMNALENDYFEVTSNGGYKDVEFRIHSSIFSYCAYIYFKDDGTDVVFGDLKGLLEQIKEIGMENEQYTDNKRHSAL